PHLELADRWFKSGLSILESELSKQIYPDGVPSEQAVSYILFVLNLNLNVWRLAELNHLEVPEIWQERLCEACEFIKNIIDINGYVPEFGDSDDGLVIRLDNSSSYNKYRSILVSGAIICDRPDFKLAAGCWDETNHWLFGEEGMYKYKNLPDTGFESFSKSFSFGGYSSMKSNGNALLFDHAPLGYLSTAAHGHADALSLWLTSNGNPILVDAGTYAYQEGGKWRAYFRGTSAHNTVRINKKDQSENHGTFLWGKKAKSKLLKWESNHDFDLAVAEHDGYKKFGIIHRRAVMFIKPDVILVEDSISGNGPYSVEQLWHFPGNCRLEIRKELVRIELNGMKYWLWHGQPAIEIDIRIINGQESPPQGWISERYGSIQPAPVLCYGGELLLPARISIGFYLNQAVSEGEIAGIMNQALDFQREIRTGEFN
ncbi:unnamed protein product, partial [marine sediment metagenome]